MYIYMRMNSQIGIMYRWMSYYKYVPGLIIYRILFIDQNTIA